MNKSRRTYLKDINLKDKSLQPQKQLPENTSTNNPRAMYYFDTEHYSAF